MAWLSTPATDIIVSFEYRNKGEADFLRRAKERFHLREVYMTALDPRFRAEEIVVFHMRLKEE